MSTNIKLKFLKDDVWNNFNISDFHFLKINTNDSEYILKFIEVNRYIIKKKLEAIFNEDPELYIKRIIFVLYNVWKSNNDFRFLNVLIKLNNFGYLNNNILSKNEKHLILNAIKTF